ncbi:hypothetical protein MMC26_007796 [Xylographa opegraphella]|nr:hypothetical protein [Xylographa opegraphella]
MYGQAAANLPVTLSLNDLCDNRVPFETLEEAFGPSSLGILLVKDLPLEFSRLREKVLSYASYLANLPPNILDSLSSPDAKYLVGWSHGKEALKDGRFDTLKGSYYVNCAFYHDPSLQNAPADNFPHFPEYTAPNIWPHEAILPGFQDAVTDICKLIINTTALVARACDRYASAHIEDYQKGYLERVVNTSLTTKARLLHYFPPPSVSGNRPSHDDGAIKEGNPEEDSWCATHVDHGCLTGLTSALYVDEGSPMHSGSSPLPSLSSLPSSPDLEAGLYICSRTGYTTKVDIPADCLAFQTGEALEVITNGKFRAVPHFVKGPKADAHGPIRVARNTLAVFTQPNLGEVLDQEKGTTFAQFARRVVDRHT